MSSARDHLNRLLGRSSQGAERTTAIPEVPPTADRSLSSFLAAVKEWIGTASGGGNLMNRLVSWSDLVGVGVARVDESGNVAAGNGTLDYTPPPPPTGLVATGAMTHILLEWDAPGYGNHAYTEIWAHSADVQGLAVLVGTSPGQMFTHPVGTAQTRYYWIRFVSKADVPGAYNASAGVVGATSQDPAFLLDVLTGQLSESQLIADLNTRIDLIDAPHTTAGSVAARIKAAQDTLQAQISELSATAAYDPAVDYALDAVVTYSGGLYQVTAETPGAGYVPTDTTYWTKIGDYDSLASAVAGLSAAIDQINYVNAGSTSASALALAGLSAQVNHATTGLPAAHSAVQTEATTRADETGDLFAQYTVKVQVVGANSYVSGFGLASTLKDATPYSEFAIVADAFSIAPVNTDNTLADGSPFFHRTAATVINGVTVPAGTYMKAAYIHDASITNAKIANLAVDNAKIASMSAAKITAGSVAVGEHIQSSNYAAGSAGWKIHGDGSMEMNSGTFRGALAAATGTFGAVTANAGVTVSSTGSIKGGATGYLTGTGFWMGYHSGAYKFHIGDPAGRYIAWTGTDIVIQGTQFTLVGGVATFSGALSAATGTFAGALSAATGSFAGALSAATGSFAGELSAATGTFSGSLTADAINAVNTVNIAGNAVSASSFVSGTTTTISTNLNIPSGVTARVLGIGVVGSVTLNNGSPPYDFSITVNGVTESTSVVSVDTSPASGSSVPATVAKEVSVPGPATVTASCTYAGSATAKKTLLLMGVWK